MKLNELPKTFWTDTRADALERQKATVLTRDFRKTLKDQDASHSEYALTISTNQSSIHKAGIWFDIDARTELCSEIYHSFVHRISSTIEPNYKRNAHADKRFISWGVIEHRSRKTGELCFPHIHATLAVHPSWEKEFLSRFERNLCKEHLSPSQDFQTRCLNSVMPAISSVRLEPIYDKYGWTTYCLKQVHFGNGIPSASDALFFTHDGFSKKKVSKICA
jgi:hypothetical protein